MEQHQHDIELGYADIQALGNADGVGALFERLGYNTSIRRIQTPANLGITADSILRPIKKIELLADQDGLLQVYLFELRSVTVAHTRAIAGAFRLLAGNYLLVLTSDYERLDFVLLEREHPTGPGSGIGAPQVKVRPRTLTVERLKPERLHLRILRRFTFTEPDPFAQYEKLTAAYTVAAWSEEYFNNRALFSDHYLSERLREFPQWNEDAKPAWRRLRELYAGAAARFGGKDETAIGRELYEPIFGALGFNAVRGVGSDGPRYLLHSPDQSDGPPLALCLAYPWDRMLDAKDYGRDNATPEANPGAQVVSLLERGDAPWVIVTNGRLWRLYSRRAHSRATNYYEIDLSDVLADQGPGPAEPGDAFRYFWLLFRSNSFLPSAVVREGREGLLSLVDRILDESEEYARKLGEDLKRRVFEDIFPRLAEGFVDFMHRAGTRSPSQNELDAIFRGTLTLLYRLLFILYAEARDLLPVKETRGYFEVSLSRLKQEIANAAGSVRDEAAARLAKRYRADSFELYDRLAEMFAVIDRGRAAINVPVYNGGLFLSDPKDADASQEAQVSHFLLENHIADRFLAPALDLLARDEDPKSFKLAPIDFKSLGVRQLGSIYEGLLEFKLLVANEKLAIVKEKNREVYRPFKELSETERERAEREQRVIAKGRGYLENDRRERKATGSYYTPDHIVAYIVEQAVGPVVKEKFDGLRPMLREAQAWHRDRIKNARVTGENPSKYESGPAVENKWHPLIDQFFNIKVLDPAMGSGHFLVQAVDYITDKALDFLNAFPWNPVTAHLADVRESIVHEMDEQGITIDIRRLTDVNLLKRHVLKRSIYGVDLNPMAVELAKVSLWLDCFTLGAPLSFLDHHLRCGNSLIGVSVPEVRDELRQGSLFGNWFAGLTLATDFMRHVGELSDVTSAQVYESRAEYRKASDELAPYKRILDVYTSQWFGNEAPKKARGKGAAVDGPVIGFLKTREADSFMKARTAPALEKALDRMAASERRIAETALAATEQRRFFHWELEFPEVFYGPRPGTERVTDRLDDAGFDAVVGNPPYVRQESLKQDKDWYLRAFANTYDAANDLYVYFMEREIEHVRSNGLVGMIVADKWLRSEYGRKLRRYLTQVTQPVSIVDFGHSPIFPDADTFPCVPIFRRRVAKARTGDDAESKDTALACRFPREDYDPYKPIGPYIAAKAERIPITGFGEDGWSLENRAVQEMLKKLRNSGDELRKLAGPPMYGIKTGFNEAFYIDESTRSRLITEDRRSADIIKPLLRGRDIFRWRPVSSRMYVILSRRGIDIDRYPAVKRHLQQFRVRLEPKPNSWTSKDRNWAGRAPGDYKWYELQASPSDDLVEAIERPKIVYQVIQFHCWFALDLACGVPNDKAFLLPTNDPCLLAVLNSPLMWWILTRTLPHMKDEALNPAGFIMETLHVRLPSGTLQKKIADHATTLGRLTEERYTEEDGFLGKLASLNGSEADRRALNWLKRPDDEFAGIVERSSSVPLSTIAKRELAALKNRSGGAIARLLAEQLRLEEELAVLVEDVYELDDEERRLLRATCPVRDPLDVLRSVQSAPTAEGA